MEALLSTINPDLDFTTEIHNMSEILNSSLSVTSTHIAAPVRPNKVLLTIIKMVYVVGIMGNAIAIVCLRRGERRVRNRKHLLLLTSLAANDLVALVGMLCAMIVSEHVPSVSNTQVYCAARVALRVFGIGSVCIAVTMALERYLALTRPFLYQKQVTYYVIRTTLLASWLLAAALTCAPVLGFGLYYDPRNGGVCLRYRNAETTSDLIYAAVYVAFGTFLCVVLVYCNLAVIRALYAVSAGGPPVRRCSRASARRPPRALGSSNAATAEEVAFSRLMAALAALFMLCWLPQMVTSTLYLSLGARWWRRLAPLAHVSDMLMLLNYVLDPVLYVLMRQRRLLARALVRCFKRNHKTSTESMKTSCCAESVLVSDSGAELRPLRSSAPPVAQLVTPLDAPLPPLPPHAPPSTISPHPLAY